MQELLESTEADLREATTAIERTEREVRHYPYHLKSRAITKLQSSRTELDKQRQALLNAKPNAMGRSDQESWREQRQRLLGSKQLIQDSDQSLDRSAAMIEEVTITGHPRCRGRNKVVCCIRGSLNTAGVFISRC